MNKLKNIFKNEKTKVIADQFLFSGINFISTIVIATVLNPNHFGIYSSVILGVYLIVSLGNAFIIQPFQVSDTTIRLSKNYALFLFIIQFIFIAIIGFLR